MTRKGFLRLCDSTHRCRVKPVLLVQDTSRLGVSTSTLEDLTLFSVGALAAETSFLTNVVATLRCNGNGGESGLQRY